KRVAYHRARRRPKVRVNGSLVSGSGTGTLISDGSSAGAASACCEVVEPRADARPSASAEASADHRARWECWSTGAGPAVRELNSSSGLGSEDISHAADRVQQLLLERAIDLLAQAADEHVYDVGLRVEVVFPHAREDHRLRHDAAAVAHQIFEEG